MAFLCSRDALQSSEVPQDGVRRAPTLPPTPRDQTGPALTLGLRFHGQGQFCQQSPARKCCCRKGPLSSNMLITRGLGPGWRRWSLGEDGGQTGDQGVKGQRGEVGVNSLVR